MTNNDLAKKYVYNTSKWQKLRKYHIQHNPICAECLKNGFIKSADQVHHITPFLTGKNLEQIIFLAFDPKNLQSLCNDCHQKKHQKNV